MSRIPVILNISLVALYNLKLFFTKKRIKMLSVVFYFASWNLLGGECRSVVCVRNPELDALY
jgi:hypothetical protein